MLPASMSEEGLDKVGYWTKIKLQVIGDYAKEYLRILRNQKFIKEIAYIDGFAGAGAHILKKTGEVIDGSPARALALKPPFDRYYFVEMNPNRAKRLRAIGTGSNVEVYAGNCNEVLLEYVFPQCRYDQFRRALCLLDPYALNPDWKVVEQAGKMGSIEIFLNFMIMDANRNVLWGNPNAVDKDEMARMSKFWGDDSWRSAAYRSEQGLFEIMEEKNSNESVVKAYCDRLKKIAGFKHVAEPLPMRNTRGAVIYYLLFASPNPIGNKIVEHIFNKYRSYRG